MAWQYPDHRYYEERYRGARPGEWGAGRFDERKLTDFDVKELIVGRLQVNEATARERIEVDVADGIVTLSGRVSSPLAKRSAGDDAWDTPGVEDVENRLEVSRESAA